MIPPGGAATPARVALTELDRLLLARRRRVGAATRRRRRDALRKEVQAKDSWRLFCKILFC